MSKKRNHFNDYMYSFSIKALEETNSNIEVKTRISRNNTIVRFLLLKKLSKN